MVINFIVFSSWLYTMMMGLSNKPKTSFDCNSYLSWKRRGSTQSRLNISQWLMSSRSVVIYGIEKTRKGWYYLSLSMEKSKRWLRWRWYDMSFIVDFVKISIIMSSQKILKFSLFSQFAQDNKRNCERNWSDERRTRVIIGMIILIYWLNSSSTRIRNGERIRWKSSSNLIIPKLLLKQRKL